MRILAVAHNTFREAVRDKVLYVLLFFAAATILGSKALGWISVGQDIKIMKDISLAAISVFGVLIAIFVGTTLIHKEIDKRTLYTILARPMHRYEFVLGKYAGLAGLLGMVCVVMTAVAALYILLLGGELEITFFYASLLSYAQLLLVTAFAILMSAVTSPILGAMVVLAMYIFGNATGILKALPEPLQGTFAQRGLEVVYYVIPNLSNFNIRAEAANGVDISAMYVAWALAYGVIYTAVLLILAILAFEGKDV